MIEFLMPSLGADMEAGTLVEGRKKPGDTVKRGDIIAEVETQKGLIEIEVFDEGVIGELLIKEGAKIPVGTVMALINPSGTVLETKETTTQKTAIAIQPTEEKIIKKRSLSSKGFRLSEASCKTLRLNCSQEISRFRKWVGSTLKLMFLSCFEALRLLRIKFSSSV